MKKYIGNIITKNEDANYKKLGFQVLKNKENIANSNLPTLVVGMELAKSIIPEFNILNKYDKKSGLWWTFNKRERGSDYNIDIENFYIFSIKNIINKTKYILIDCIIDDNALNDFKDVVNEKGKKYCYVDSNKFIFLFNEERNIVYGFSIENYQYVYDTTYNFIQELNRNDIVFIKTFEKLPYKIRTIVNNKIHNYLVLYSYFV